MKVSRGDVVLLPIAFVSGQGTKVRPAVVLQNDSLNARLNSTVVAIITSTNVRVHTEPSQLFINVNSPDGRRTGLLHNSTVKGEHVDTVDQRGRAAQNRYFLCRAARAIGDLHQGGPRFCVAG